LKHYFVLWFDKFKKQNQTVTTQILQLGSLKCRYFFLFFPKKFQEK
jgi:hypothetical protein